MNNTTSAGADSLHVQLSGGTGIQRSSADRQFSNRMEPDAVGLQLDPWNFRKPECQSGHVLGTVNISQYRMVFGIYGLQLGFMLLDDVARSDVLTQSGQVRGEMGGKPDGMAALSGVTRGGHDGALL